MMKKKMYIALIIIAVFALIVGIYKITANDTEPKENKEPTTKKTPTTGKSVLDHDYYKGLSLEDIVSIEVVFYGEGGEQSKTYTEQDDIERIYNGWKNTKLGKETQQACEDNTTVYIFKLKDNATISIEKECDWVIINKKRYLIK